MTILSGVGLGVTDAFGRLIGSSPSAVGLKWGDVSVGRGLGLRTGGDACALFGLDWGFSSASGETLRLRSGSEAEERLPALSSLTSGLGLRSPDGSAMTD